MEETEKKEKKKTATAAHMKATAKWEKENYDKVLVRFPKGTKDRIVNDVKAKSVNGYIVNAVLEKIESDIEENNIKEKKS